MKKSEWNDEQLEELLKTMPKLKSHRDPNEVLQQILTQPKESYKEQKRLKTWLIPTIASAAAFALFFIIFINTINPFDSFTSSGNKESSDQAGSKEEEKAINPTIDTPDQNSVNMDVAEKKVDEPNFDSTGVDSTSTVLYKDELAGKDVFTVSVPDEQGMYSIPVSFITEQSTNRFETLVQKMDELAESNLGLSDYYPLKAKLSLNSDQTLLNVDLPQDQAYQYGSAGEQQFLLAISTLLNTLGIQQAQFFTEGNKGIQLGNVGLVETQMADPTISQRRGYFLYYPNEAVEKPFLLAFREPYQTVEEALKAMSKDTSEGSLLASIPAQVKIENIQSDVKNQLLLITFTRDTTMSETPQTLHMIEAILLTAKSFGFTKVKFENTPINSIGTLNFGEELSVPIAENKIEVQ